MDIVSAIASVNALLIAVLIAGKKQKSISDFILIAWVINFAFHFAIPFLIERQVVFHESLWGFVMGLFVVAHAPFIFVYTNSLANPEFKFDLKNLWHFGLILIYVATFIPYLSLNPQARMDLVQHKQDLSLAMFLPMMTLLMLRVYFLIRTILVILKHQYSIKQSYSYEKKINLAWLKRIAYGFFALIVLSFVCYGLVSARLITIFWMDYILIMGNMLLFFYIAFSGYRQAAVLPIIPYHGKRVSPAKEQASTRKSVETKAEGSADHEDPVLRELLSRMEQDKLYLDPELNIGNIAYQLNIHSHQLSKLINSKLGKNFFEFVNEYRVEEFKKLVADPRNKHISILGLAMDAGFNSKATFNRIFKHLTGLTPSRFRESYKF